MNGTLSDGDRVSFRRRRESTVWLMCTKDMMGEKSKSFVAQRENYWEIGFPRCPLRERNLKLLFVKLTA